MSLVDTISQLIVGQMYGPHGRVVAIHLSEKDNIALLNEMVIGQRQLAAASSKVAIQPLAGARKSSVLFIDGFSAPLMEAEGEANEDAEEMREEQAKNEAEAAERSARIAETRAKAQEARDEAERRPASQGTGGPPSMPHSAVELASARRGNSPPPGRTVARKNE